MSWLLFSFLSGMPGAPLPRQAGPELTAATCSSSSAAANRLINELPFKLSTGYLLLQQEGQCLGVAGYGGFRLLVCAVFFGSF